MIYQEARTSSVCCRSVVFAKDNDSRRSQTTTLQIQDDPLPYFLLSLPSKHNVQYVALYKIGTCPRRDRHSRAFPVEDVLSACSSHRPSCPPAPCRGGSRARSALFELLLLLLLDQVLRTGGVVNDHRLTVKLTRRSQSSSPFLSSPQLGTRGSTTAYFHRQGGAAVRNPPPTRTASQPPTHPTSLPQHHCIVLTFDSWHWHHSILNSIGIINLACPVFTFCKSC